VFVEKRREGGAISGGTIVGNVSGRAVIVLDDLCASGSTLITVCLRRVQVYLLRGLSPQRISTCRRMPPRCQARAATAGRVPASRSNDSGRWSRAFGSRRARTPDFRVPRRSGPGNTAMPQRWNAADNCASVRATEPGHPIYRAGKLGKLPSSEPGRPLFPWERSS